MIISYEKQILGVAFAASAALTTILATVPSWSAVFNALGRIGYSTLSDKLQQRNTVYMIIFSTSILFSMFVFGSNAIYSEGLLFSILVIAFLFVSNAGYGGGFSTLPALLSERFGMNSISQIHGLTLSAWAIAGLTGNNTSEIILSSGGNYTTVITIGALLYVIAIIICSLIVGKKPKEI